MNDHKPKYKPQDRPYSEDINDLVEKGRGPDKQKRKSRGEAHQEARTLNRINAREQHSQAIDSSTKHGQAVKQGKVKAGANRYHAETLKLVQEQRRKMKKTYTEDINDLVKSEIDKSSKSKK